LGGEDGVKLYQQYSTKIPFVDDLAPAHPLSQPQGSYTPRSGHSPPPHR
jgi:hypothetical protein